MPPSFVSVATNPLDGAENADDLRADRAWLSTKGRESEVVLVEYARRKEEVEYVGEMFKAKDLWPLSDGVREAFGAPYNDRTFCCIVSPCYIPLSKKLAEDPDSLIKMAKQLIECEQLICFACLQSHVTMLH